MQKREPLAGRRETPLGLLGRSVIAVALLVGHAGNAYALDPTKAISQYVHALWDSDKGLPQNSVSAVIQTRDGYIWFGTQEGLVRFDGVRFTIFDTRHGAIPHNYVTALVEDHDGALWIGTNDGALTRHVGGRFTIVKPPDSRSITALAELPDGSVWIGTREDGVFSFVDDARVSL